MESEKRKFYEDRSSNGKTNYFKLKQDSFKIKDNRFEAENIKNNNEDS